MTERLIFSSATTTKPHTVDAADELISQIKEEMDTHPIDFLQLFLTPHFRLRVGEISERLRAELAPKVLLGCTAEAVIGRDQEIEKQPAMSAVAASLPQVTLTPFKLQSMKWHETLDNETIFQEAIQAPPDTKLVILQADPFTTPIDRALASFNKFYPNLPVIGGLASGSTRPGGNALLFNDEVLSNGGVGVAFSGAIDVDIIVSQGCRPIGEPITVTETHENTIVSIDEQMPLEYLQNLVHHLPPEDQELLQQGLFIGRAIDSSQDVLGRGDFLIRGVMGIDREKGSLVVGDRFKVGEKVQFHLRDATTAEEDLEMMLTPQMLYGEPAGGLLFSCNGRGMRLYDHPDGDISTIQKIVGGVNMAGFFCAGEIGPVGGKNFIHGHTASMVLFRSLGE